MRARVLTVIAASALVLVVATPSSAAPQRSITLTPEGRTASWTSDLRAGPYSGFECDQRALGCETTLITLTRAGVLSVATTQRVPGDTYEGGGLALSVTRSDDKGNAGRPVNSTSRRSGATTSISTRSLAAGYYLLSVSWQDLTVGTYTGTANYGTR